METSICWRKAKKEEIGSDTACGAEEIWAGDYIVVTRPEHFYTIFISIIQRRYFIISKIIADNKAKLVGVDKYSVLL